MYHSRRKAVHNLTFHHIQGDSGEEHMKTVLEKAKTLKSVGYFPKDQFKGPLAKQWMSKLKDLEIDQVWKEYISYPKAK